MKSKILKIYKRNKLINQMVLTKNHFRQILKYRENLKFKKVKKCS